MLYVYFKRKLPGSRKMFLTIEPLKPSVAFHVGHARHLALKRLVFWFCSWWSRSPLKATFTERL